LPSIHKKKYILLVVLALVGVIVGGVLFLGNRSDQAPQTAVVGKTAPGFSLSDLDGNMVNFSPRQGKIIYLFFWATWCPYCVQEAKALQSFVESAGDKVEVVAVNSGEPREQVKAFVHNNNITYTVLLDQDGKVGRQYLVRGIPVTWIIDKHGIIWGNYVGALGIATLQNILTVVEKEQSYAPRQ